MEMKRKRERKREREKKREKLTDLVRPKDIIIKQRET